ncbi:hypothetical protein [Nostoc commune]|nr:hypothetical protein [Nostoc commune]
MFLTPEEISVSTADFNWQLALQMTLVKKQNNAIAARTPIP